MLSHLRWGGEIRHVPYGPRKLLKNGNSLLLKFRGYIFASFSFLPSTRQAERCSRTICGIRGQGGCLYSCIGSRSYRILTFSWNMHLLNPPPFSLGWLELFLWKADKQTPPPILCLTIVIKMRFLPFPSDGPEPLLYSSGIDHLLLCPRYSCKKQKHHFSLVKLIKTLEL